jgi:5-methylcytosine-specific restriction endonuclease McrA
VPVTALAEYEERRQLERKRAGERKRQAIPQAVLDAKITHRCCRLCTTGAVEAHHVVPRSKWRTGDATVNDPNNVIPLCHVHHQDHHTTTRRVPRQFLTYDEQLFAFEHTSEAWIDKWYPNPSRGCE